VADCAKLVLSHDFKVDRNATTGDDRIPIDLSALAQDGLKAGNGTLPPMEEPSKAPAATN
jgi:hypothetical protein